MNLTIWALGGIVGAYPCIDRLEGILVFYKSASRKSRSLD